jgi:NADH:ubiquinone oxidoreductase subunit E
MPDDGSPTTVIACVKTRLEGSPSCGGRGSPAVIAALQAEAARRGVDLWVQEIQCLGRCTLGPNLRIKGGAFFTGMTVARAGEVCEAVAAHRAGAGAAADSAAIPPAARG